MKHPILAASIAAIAVAIMTPDLRAAGILYTWESTSGNINWNATVAAPASYSGTTPWDPDGTPDSADDLGTPTGFGTMIVNNSTMAVHDFTFSIASTSSLNIVTNSATNSGTVVINGTLNYSSTSTGQLIFRGSASNNLLNVSIGILNATAGVLKLGSTATSSLTSLTIGSATLSNNAQMLLNVGPATGGTGNITDTLNMSGTSIVHLRGQGDSGTTGTGTLSVGGLSSAATTTIIDVNTNNSNFSSGVLNLNNAPNITTTFAGLIRNGGGAGNLVSVTKTNTGTQILTGSNTYTGPTTISGGTLLANTPGASASATGTGTVSVDTAGTLGGTGRISGAVNINLGGTLAPGVVDGTAQTLTIASPVTFGTGASGSAPLMRLELLPSNASDKLVLSGAGASGLLTLSNPDALDLVYSNLGTYTIATFASEIGIFDTVTLNGAPAVAGIDYNLFYNANDITVQVLTVIPEPATALSLLNGAAFLAAVRRRRQS